MYDRKCKIVGLEERLGIFDSADVVDLDNEIADLACSDEEDTVPNVDGDIMEDVTMADALEAEKTLKEDVKVVDDGECEVWKTKGSCRLAGPGRSCKWGYHTPKVASRSKVATMEKVLEFEYMV